MVFSIRKRMFLIVLALVAPLCFFAWLLMQEVDKQVDFAAKEIKGIHLQKPLTTLLRDVHAHKLALLAGTGREPSSIAGKRTEIRRIYDEVGRDVGFTEQALSPTEVAKIALELKASRWDAVHEALDGALAALPNTNDKDSLTQMDKTISAIKAMITRTSDGSNLTLDPDLDSYYLMDASSFAIPAAIDNLGNAQAEIVAMIKNKNGALSPEQFGRVATLQYMLESDMSRILGSLGTALSEDANFYGASDSLSRLKPMMEDYETKNKALLAWFEKLRGEVSVDENEVVAAFENVTGAVMVLGTAVPEEMDILFGTRIADFNAHKQQLLMQGGTALAAGLALFLLVSRSIVGPINRLRALMQELAAGKIDIEIPYLKKRDEIGQMANAVVVFKQNAVSMRSIAKEFETSVQHVVEIVASAATELDSASKNLTKEASESHQRLRELNTDIGNVSDNMATISASGEQLSCAINEISSQVQKSTQTTHVAVNEAENVKKVAETLSQAADRVSGIVSLIHSIASKINLLALNATIEAARAGDAGKGFAVVASEVKILANQTASATAEIGQLVDAIQSSSRQTLEAITQISGVIEQINHISSSIAAAVEEQGVSTKDIAGHIKQATDRLASVTSNAGVITESAASSAAASAQTLQASGDLSKQSEILRSDVSTFLRKLLAA